MKKYRKEKRTKLLQERNEKKEKTMNERKKINKGNRRKNYIQVPSYMAAYAHA